MNTECVHREYRNGKSYCTVQPNLILPKNMRCSPSCKYFKPIEEMEE